MDRTVRLIALLFAALIPSIASAAVVDNTTLCPNDGVKWFKAQGRPNECASAIPYNTNFRLDELETRLATCRSAYAQANPVWSSVDAFVQVTSSSDSTLYFHAKANYSGGFVWIDANFSKECVAPECEANPGDLVDLGNYEVQGTVTPVGDADLCIDHCLVKPFFGLQITANTPVRTGIIQYATVKDPATYCSNSATPPESTLGIENGKRCVGGEQGQTDKACLSQNHTLSEMVYDDPGDNAQTPVRPDNGSNSTNVISSETGCVQTAGGSVYCRQDAEATPVNADDQVIPPDGQIQLHAPFGPGGVGGTINYYNSQTINNYACNYGGNPQGCGNDGPNCGPGTHQSGGVCVADAPDCGAGTHAENGTCVPDGSGDGGDNEPTCQDDPATPEAECGGGSASGSGCTQPPQCSGDPVQCFQVRKQWETMCSMVVPESARMDDAINYGLGVSGAAKEGDLLSEEEVNVNDKYAHVFQVGGTNGTCIEDSHIDITIGGQALNVTIPLSRWCPVFDVLHALILVSAGLISLRILLAPSLTGKGIL